MRSLGDQVISICNALGTKTPRPHSLYILMDGGIVSVSVSPVGLTPDCTPNYLVSVQLLEQQKISQEDTHRLYQVVQAIKYVSSLMHMKPLNEIVLLDGTLKNAVLKGE